MHEHHLTVPRTARYVTLRDPRETNGVREVWFALHGYGQLAASFAQQLRAIDDDSRLIVIPEALSRFYVDPAAGRHGPGSKVGATWMTREDRLAEIEDYVTYLDLLYDTVFADVERSRVQVTALGFSQGVATVARWAARGRAALDSVIAWGATIPSDAVTPDSRLRSKRLTLVSGTRDEFASSQALVEHRDWLRAHGVNHQAVAFDGGHRLDDDTLRKIAARTNEQ